MRILVLGGTRFLGRHLVEMLLARGDQIVLFNRGKSNPELFPQATTILGERAAQRLDFGSSQFDAVVDLSGHLPGDVRRSAEANRSAGLYCFISSVSVYANAEEPPNEATRVAELPEGADPTTFTIESFGALKALCEREAASVFGEERTLVIRPGLIVGPHDPTDRFTYWPVRVARGGEVLAPREPALPVQFIDVRDLAAWIVAALDARLAGTFNATLPPGLGLGELLDASRRVARSDARFVWVDEAFLEEAGVAPWSELPLWIPRSAREDGLMRTDVSRALAQGLKIRPLDETIAATLAWAHERDPAWTWKAGLDPAREGELLALAASRGARRDGGPMRV
ncbi:MAG: NAD-dependent epimerase/dehydratase family protein [Candidatus Eremiobacteraeota bacterium]|nr:NAD-dependent epimerase/dehydratase family protein [Candidatus Eremiobacteraeota bacterium]